MLVASGQGAMAVNKPNANAAKSGASRFCANSINHSIILIYELRVLIDNFF